MTATVGKSGTVPQGLKRVYHAVRNLPDRLLHRRRHRIARRRLTSAPVPRSVLVICHGNICRSPYLEAVLRRRLPDLRVASAGFLGSDRAVPTLSLEVSTRRGLDLSQHRSRPITTAAVNTADLIIVMDPDQARELKNRFQVGSARVVLAADLDPTFHTARGIPDPFNQSAEVFESSFDRLDRCAESLVEALGRS